MTKNPELSDLISFIAFSKTIEAMKKHQNLTEKLEQAAHILQIEMDDEVLVEAIEIFARGLPKFVEISLELQELLEKVK